MGVPKYSTGVINLNLELHSPKFNNKSTKLIDSKLRTMASLDSIPETTEIRWRQNST